jgi:hypothetical protein
MCEACDAKHGALSPLGSFDEDLVAYRAAKCDAFGEEDIAVIERKIARKNLLLGGGLLLAAFALFAFLFAELLRSHAAAGFAVSMSLLLSGLERLIRGALQWRRIMKGRTSR